MADAQHPPVKVYLGARVYDRERTIRHRRGKLKGRKKSGGMRACWSLVLERWTPEEVRQIIIDTFTRLANEEEAAAAAGGVDGRREGSVENG